MNQNENWPIATRRKLDFALIGTQKSATSWMYYCLQDHPGICVPSKKLEAGYIGGPMFGEKGEAWFFDRFRCQPSQIVGDVSVEYLYNQESAANLSTYCDHPKLILSLRNPVDRLISGYFWLVRRGQLENLPIEQGLIPVLDQAPGFPVALDGNLEEVVRRSCYGPQIQAFAAQFDPASLYVLLYEDISCDALAQIQRLYRFLGANDKFIPPSLKIKPKHYANSSFLLTLENRFPRNKLVEKIADHSNRLLARSRGTVSRKILPPAVRQKLELLFAPTIDATISTLAALPTDQRPSIDHIRRAWGTRQET